jgi:carbon-monoxide dehydrogenase large subunit
MAAKLGMDPVDIRRRNFVRPDEFPYTTPGGVTYDSGAYAQALDLALERANYPALREDQAVRRGRGELMGVGVATYTESAGGGFQTG